MIKLRNIIDSKPSFKSNYIPLSYLLRSNDKIRANNINLILKNRNYIYPDSTGDYYNKLFSYNKKRNRINYLLTIRKNHLIDILSHVSLLKKNLSEISQFIDYNNYLNIFDNNIFKYFKPHYLTLIVFTPSKNTNYVLDIIKAYSDKGINIEYRDDFSFIYDDMLLSECSSFEEINDYNESRISNFRKHIISTNSSFILEEKPFEIFKHFWNDAISKKYSDLVEQENKIEISVKEGNLTKSRFVEIKEDKKVKEFKFDKIEEEKKPKPLSNLDVVVETIEEEPTPSFTNPLENFVVTVESDDDEIE